MTRQDPPGLLVLGIGNRDRGDDAVGPVVCDLLARSAGPEVRTLVLESSPLDLAIRWDLDDDVVVVDAARPNGHPGRIREVDALGSTLVSPRTVSTHDVDLGAAIEIARAVDGLPRSLRIVSIEAAGFDFGAGLSPDVEQAAIAAADRLGRRHR
jgi:hydrogenase maturation protease